MVVRIEISPAEKRDLQKVKNVFFVCLQDLIYKYNRVVFLDLRYYWLFNHQMYCAITTTQTQIPSYLT